MGKVVMSQFRRAGDLAEVEELLEGGVEKFSPKTGAPSEQERKFNITNFQREFPGARINTQGRKRDAVLFFTNIEGNNMRMTIDKIKVDGHRGVRIPRGFLDPNVSIFVFC